MKNVNLYIAHFCNNMHGDLFDSLKSVQVFGNGMAVLTFMISRDFMLVPQSVEPMRSVSELSNDEIKRKFDVLLDNEIDSDLEVIRLNMHNMAEKRIILHKPVFTAECTHVFNYDSIDSNINVFAYIVKFESVEEKEI